MDNTEENKPKAEGEQHRCLSCNATSDSRPLVHIEHEREERWVCVRCLPMLIHG